MRLFFLLLMIFSANIFAATATPASPPIERVIYITLDGVRWQDFFAKEHFFKTLWEQYREAAFYGKPIADKPMEVASVAISLPSYQSQMAGRVQPCVNNYCGRILTETLPEQLITKEHWEKKDVAVFSSWGHIEYAVQHIPNTVYSNTGNLPVYEVDSQHADPIMTELNQKQAADVHFSGNRHDKYTFAHALHYFDKYRPKFLWVSLVNADDAAHAVNLPLYHEVLQSYDLMLAELFDYLKTHQLLQNTLVIVTTDHGRGEGSDWTSHGPFFPESKATWAFVLNGSLAPVVDRHVKTPYSTLSIRPTIAAAFKLKNL